MGTNFYVYSSLFLFTLQENDAPALVNANPTDSLGRVPSAERLEVIMETGPGDKLTQADQEMGGAHPSAPFYDSYR